MTISPGFSMGHPGRPSLALFARLLRLTLAALLAFALPLTLPSARAEPLSQTAMARHFPAPLRVGEKLASPPIWPITDDLQPDAGPVAYAFESEELAPLPGFEGSPMNFLVTVDKRGNFLGVEVLHQHEPVFLMGLGEAPLQEFVGQYVGHHLGQVFRIGRAGLRGSGALPGESAGGVVTLDGISKATASVRVANQSILAAALVVAREKLGLATRSDRSVSAPATPKPQVQARLDFAGLLAEGLVAHLRLTRREAEALFQDTDVAGADPLVAERGDEALVDLYLACLSMPTVGVNLLGEEAYGRIMARNRDGSVLWWIGAAGDYPVLDERFVPGGISARLSLSQDGLPAELRDQGEEPAITVPGQVLRSTNVFGTYAGAGIDPGRPVTLHLVLHREKGQVLPRVAERSVDLPYQLPTRLFDYPPKPRPEWLAAWEARWADLLILAVALALLSRYLHRATRHPLGAAELGRFRLAFLLFTLIFIGWYAQGQLSMVQITGTLKSLRAGRSPDGLLYDPVALLLMAYTLGSLVVWGRGTFCGWLCPFGALQELAHLLTGRLLGRRISPRLTGYPRLQRIPALARLLEAGPFLALALLVGAALFFPQVGESLNELEPFKTAITLGFDRSLAYDAYALAWLAAGLVWFKPFCRFLCPLGAALRLGGGLRLRHWLSRRPACGQPCQACRAKCRYDAIAPTGAIRYGACFQCLDCVALYHDPQRCVPLVWQRRGVKQAMT